MSEANLFGGIVSGNMVERAVKASLELWLDTYLGELERIEGYEPNAIQRPLGVVTASEFAKWPEDQVPLVLVIAANAAKVVKRGGGSHEAEWPVGVAPIVSDVDHDETRRLALTYAAAVRAAIGQHKLLRSPLHPNGFAASTQWLGEDYTDIAFDETRTLGTARVIFGVTVEKVLDAYLGPEEPLEDPTKDPGPIPVVTPPIHVTVKPVEAIA